MRAIIVHGCLGHPQENWFPWLAEQISELGHQALVPQFPTPQDQNLNNWRKVFQQEAGSIDADTVLIGHSAGAPFVLRMLEESIIPARATFLVAPFAKLIGVPEFDPLIQSFVSEPFDWNAIQQNAGDITIYAGDNDPWVPLELSSSIADALGVNLQIICKGGHLNTSAGFEKFETLLDAYKAITWCTTMCSNSSSTKVD